MNAAKKGIGLIGELTVHPWLAIGFSLILILLLGAGANRLQVQTDLRGFFDDENEQVRSLELIEDTFSKSSVFLIVLTPDSGKIFTPGMLGLIGDITEQSWRIPYVRRVESITNYPYTTAEGDDLTVEELVDIAHLTPSMISRASRVAREEHLINGRLVSENQDVAVISINFQLPDKPSLTEEYRQVFQQIEQMIAPYRQTFPNVTFRFGGDVYMNFALGDYSTKDMQRLMPLMLAIMSVLLVIFYRSLAVTVATTLLMLGSIIATMGAAGWLGFTLSSGTMVVPVVVLTLAVAHGVHVSIALLAFLAKGQARQQAILSSFRRTIKAITMTSATTAVGMLTLNFSESPPFRDLGNMVALGVVVTFTLSLTFLPGLLAVIPVRAGGYRGGLAFSGVEEAFGGFAGLVTRHYRGILIITGSLALILAAFAPFNDVSDEARKYYKEGTMPREAHDYTTKHVSGQQLMDIGLYTNKPGEVHNPEFLQLVERLTQWLRNHPGVAHVYSIVDTFKRLNQNLHGDDPNWYRIPLEKDLAAQALLLYEMSLPLGLDLTNQVSMDKSATRIFVILKEPESSGVLAVENEINDWLAKNAPELESHLGGVTLMFSHIGEKNIPSMIRALFVALVLISALLVIALGSLKIGLISLIPNLLPLAAGFGVWELVSGEINLAVSVVASISIGIVVDDTVHFLNKYREGRKTGLSSTEAVRLAFQQVGAALVATSVVLSAGFLVLILSDFTLLSDMGLLTAVIVVLALLFDLLLLPALLLMLDKTGREKTVGARSHSSV